MSEARNSSFESQKNILLEHEPRVRSFLDTIHGQLDNATDTRDNDGNLSLTLNDDNIFAAQWNAKAPRLPGYLADIATFEPGSPVTIHARHQNPVSKESKYALNSPLMLPIDDYLRI